MLVIKRSASSPACDRVPRIWCRARFTAQTSSLKLIPSESELPRCHHNCVLRTCLAQLHSNRSSLAKHVGGLEDCSAHQGRTSWQVGSQRPAARSSPPQRYSSGGVVRRVPASQLQPGRQTRAGSSHKVSFSAVLFRHHCAPCSTCSVPRAQFIHAERNTPDLG